MAEFITGISDYQAGEGFEEIVFGHLFEIHLCFKIPLKYIKMNPRKAEIIIRLPGQCSVISQKPEIYNNRFSFPLY